MIVPFIYTDNNMNNMGTERTTKVCMEKEICQNQAERKGAYVK